MTKTAERLEGEKVLALGLVYALSQALYGDPTRWRSVDFDDFIHLCISNINDKDFIRDQLSDKIKENNILKTSLYRIRDLINHSEGVAGLHSNGDLAYWDDLQEGGQYEDWLLDFNKAEDLL